MESALAVFTFLLGRCWSAQLSPTDVDTHCYAAVYGAAHVRDRHAVTRDGKPIYEGKPKPVAPAAAGEPAGSVGSFFIGRELTPGEYVLGVTVTETGGKKPRTATQFIDFEVVQ